MFGKLKFIFKYPMLWAKLRKLDTDTISNYIYALSDTHYTVIYATTGDWTDSEWFINRNDSQGVCWHLREYTRKYGVPDELRTELMECMVKYWRHYSGDPIYPVSDSVFSDAQLSYHSHQAVGALWDGRQKYLRIDLINFMDSLLSRYKLYFRG